MTLREEVERLKAENERLRQELKETDWLNGRLARLLSEVANALKGEPKPHVLHDWSDLPVVARRVAKKARKRK